MSPLALSFITGPGNEHDSKRFVEVLGMIRIGIEKGILDQDLKK